MPGIYFIDKQHETNFKKTILRWPQSKNNTEYKSACYILAIPKIFEKVESYLDGFDDPTAWIYQWEWKYKLSKMDEYKDLYEEVPEVNYDLTNSMVQLGRLSLNLWNGYEYFNLLDCISVLDDKNYNVLKCAIDIRMRKVE